MPDADDELLLGDDGSPALREARAAIKRLQAQKKEQDTLIAQLQAEAGRVAQLDRELAFARAGVPADDPFGSYFAKGYDGPLTAEAIKEAWTTLRPASTEPPGSVPHDAAPPQAQQQLRNELAGIDRTAALTGGPDLSPSAEAAFNAALAAVANKGPAAIHEVLAQHGRLARPG